MLGTESKPALLPLVTDVAPHPSRYLAGLISDVTYNVCHTTDLPMSAVLNAWNERRQAHDLIVYASGRAQSRYPGAVTDDMISTSAMPLLEPDSAAWKSTASAGLTEASEYLALFQQAQAPMVELLSAVVHSRSAPSPVVNVHQTNTSASVCLWHFCQVQARLTSAAVSSIQATVTSYSTSTSRYAVPLLRW